jgi:hypothetical protein
MDSGTAMTVFRPRGELNGYIFIRTDINPTADDMRMIEGLSEPVVKQLILDIRMELARFRVGYSALAVPIRPFNVFKRIPINENLTDHTLVGALEEVEAALSAVAITYLLCLQRSSNNVTTSALPRPISQ